jgi:DNA-binding transcriptional MocR family regulator
MLRILQASSLQPGTLAQHLAWGVLEQIDWSRHLALLRATYKSRARALSNCCAALGLPSDLPRGGFFLWARTPADATTFAQCAANRGVFAVPELAFRHPRHPGSDQHVRLSFARYFDQPLQREKLRNMIESIPATTVRRSR